MADLSLRRTQLQIQMLKTAEDHIRAAMELLEGGDLREEAVAGQNLSSSLLIIQWIIQLQQIDLDQFQILLPQHTVHTV